MAEQKKPDSDLSGVLVGCGVFTIALMIIDITYGKWDALMAIGWLKWMVIISQIAIIGLWVTVITKLEDPNYDKFRKILLAVNIAALLLILAHRAFLLEDQQMQNDSNKAKTEQHVN